MVDMIRKSRSLTTDNGQGKIWNEENFYEDSDRRSINVKAKISNYDEMKQSIESVAGSEGFYYLQEDTFFNSPRGHLKLREYNTGESLLMFDNELEIISSTTSKYCYAEIKDLEATKSILQLAYGIKGIVKTERIITEIGQAKIHIDRVENLGDFVEILVELTHDQTLEDGEEVARNLMEELEIEKESKIDCRYIDMLAQSDDCL